MRLIDAEALKEIIKERRTNIEKGHGIEVGFAIGMLLACEAIIDKQPTIEAKPIVHAHWFLLDDCANEGVYCSACTKKVYKTNYANQKLKSKYCPNCGAQMDEFAGDTNVGSKTENDERIREEVERIRREREEEERKYD